MTDQPKWQPIETAPKDGSIFLIGGMSDYRNPVAHNCWQMGLAHWRLDGKSAPIWIVSDYGRFEYATHWMPLPAPPTENE